jgi:methyl-accepting chemotaxis protein
MTFKRALIGFGVLMTALQVAFLTFTVVALGYLNQGVGTDYPNANAYADDLMMARYASVQIQQFLTDASLTGDADSFTQGKANYDLLIQSLDRAATLQPAQKATFDDLKAKGAAVYQSGLVMANAYLKQGKAAGDAIMKKPGTGFDASTSAIDDKLMLLDKQANDQFADVQGDITGDAQNIRNAEVVGVVIVLLVYVLMTVWLYRAFIVPLTQMREVVVSVCEQLDFSRRVPVKRHDEIGETVGAFNQLLDKMQGSLSALQQDVHTLGGTVERLSKDSGQVSISCNTQSEAASSMASGVEQMTVAIGQVASQAEEARQASSRTGEMAQHGRSVIESTVEDIHEISRSVKNVAQGIRGLVASSQEIDNVAREIGEIADQTNLLALNAAIEAARAGESGRGFAVVADEVRKLAERTTASTREIAQTIQSMRESASQSVVSTDEAVARVDQGVARAGKVTETIGNIEKGSAHASKMANDISEAIQEQGSVSGDLSRQIERVAAMTRENSGAAHDTHVVANELDALARRMLGVISAYRL